MSGSAPRPASSPGARFSPPSRQQVVAALFAVAGVLELVAPGDWHSDGTRLFGAVAMLAASALLLRIDHRRRQLGALVAVVNRAFIDLVAGRADEAERELASIAQRAQDHPHVRRGVDLQRTVIAMRRGKMDEAVAWSTRVLEGKTRFQTSLAESVQIVEGRAMRALALASLGRGDEVLADAAIVESSPVLGPSALARTSLARAVLLARASRTTELQAHYAAEGEALVEQLLPREQALSRALRRMGQPRARSVYREAASLEEPGDETARDWVRKIAPEAARFVPATVQVSVASGTGDRAAALPRSPPPERRASVAATVAVALPVRLRRIAQKPLFRFLAWWLVLIALYASIWSFARPASHPSSGEHGQATVDAWTSLETPLLMFVGAIVIGVGVVVWRRRRYGRQLQIIQQAKLALARGRDPEALARLEALARDGGIGLGPTACLTLAAEALRRGDDDDALQACTEGIRLATSTAQARSAHHTIVLPELRSTRAFALASAGRLAEARETLAALERDHPQFAYRARAAFRVGLIDAVKRGDVAAVSRIVATREPEMSVDLRVDLLGEVACAAAAGGLPDEAAEALRSELTAMPRVASWIDQVAPGLTARIGRPHEVRVATPFVSRTEALREEDTVRLDEEAAQLIALGARRPRS